MLQKYFAERVTRAKQTPRQWASARGPDDIIFRLTTDDTIEFGWQANARVAAETNLTLWHGTLAKGECHSERQDMYVHR